MKHLNQILIVFLLATGATTTAQPGTLDNTFNFDGKVTTDFGPGADDGRSVAIQSDGKIVVAGSGSVGTTRDFALARYYTDGTLDNSFSGDGKIITDFSTDNDEGQSVAIQPDGKIVVAGYAQNGTNRDFAIARYNTDGSLDNSFSVDGRVTTDFSTGNDEGQSVAIQPDGKIVVAGYAQNGTNRDFAIARYNTDGSLDNSFSGDGKVTTAFGAYWDSGSSVAIQLDEKIVVTGETANGVDLDLAMARYNADGSLDSSFSGDGKVTTAFGTGDDYGRSVAIQPDGKILVAGGSSYGTFGLARYNTNGTLDNSFGGVGFVGGVTRYSAAIQLDGKILVAGSSNIGTSDAFNIARYNTDGTLDNSFLGGIVIADFGTGNDRGYSVAIQPNLRIVVAGASYIGTNGYFAVVRYLSGLYVGVVEFSLSNNAPLIYPNPIDAHATLKYTLQSDETISIHLFDMQGRTVQTFIERQVQPAGEHRQSIDLPDALPSGTYLITISSPNGKFTVQVVK